jgi:hypothetical protein
MFVLTAWVMGWPLAFATAGAPGVELEAEQPGPDYIVGGDDAGVCQFPSVVSMLVFGGSTMICSGTLIHPQVVLTSAHCLIPDSPIDSVGFGELTPDVGEPALVVDTVQCEGHPGWAENESHDVAYCILEQPVGVDIVPLIAGCENDALQVGQETVIVGFGSTFAIVDPDTGEFLEIEGIGTKRYTTQTIHSHDTEMGFVNMVGVDNMHSACFGDSGGPAFVRLSDGTWRVFGTGGHLFDPGNAEPPPDGNTCGIGVAYGNAGAVAGWLEEQTGFDLTPCHDAAGTFTGGPECTSFPQETHHVNGTWGDGCAGGQKGAAAEVCTGYAGPFDPDPGVDPDPDPDPDTGDPTDPTITTDPTDPTDPDPTVDPTDPNPDPTVDPTITTTDDVPPDPTIDPTTDTPDPATDGSSGDESSSGTAGESDLVGRGCGCTAPARGGAGWLAPLVVLALARRRRC